MLHTNLFGCRGKAKIDKKYFKVKKEKYFKVKKGKTS